MMQISHLHMPMPMPMPLVRRAGACSLRLLAGGLVAVALTACSTKAPQGYGLALQPSTAAQAQWQMKAAEEAVQVDTTQTYLDLIAQMQQNGQWYASLAHADAFEGQYGPRPESRLLRADALRNTGQHAAAEPIYQSLLIGRTAARARRGLGLLQAAAGNYPGAVQQLELARQLNPIDATVLSDIAYAHMLDGRLEAARVPALQAAQLAPDNARVQLNLALYWLATGQEAQAAALLRRLSTPAGKGVAPLIDQASVQTLQQQLPLVLQAARSRAGQAGAPLPQAANAPTIATAIPAPVALDNAPVIAPAIAPATAAPLATERQSLPPLPLARSASQIVDTVETVAAMPAPDAAAAAPAAILTQTQTQTQTD